MRPKLVLIFPRALDFGIRSRRLNLIYQAGHQSRYLSGWWALVSSSCRHLSNIAMLQAVRAILVTGPLGQIVVDVDNPQAVENVAGWFE